MVTRVPATAALVSTTAVARNTATSLDAADLRLLGERRDRLDGGRPPTGRSSLSRPHGDRPGGVAVGVRADLRLAFDGIRGQRELRARDRRALEEGGVDGRDHPGPAQHRVAVRRHLDPEPRLDDGGDLQPQLSQLRLARGEHQAVVADRQVLQRDTDGERAVRVRRGPGRGDGGVGIVRSLVGAQGHGQGWRAPRPCPCSARCPRR